MLFFVVKVIAVSIAVSLFAAWMKLIPRYQRRKDAFLMQLINTGILTLVLTVLFTFGIYLSWLITFGLILAILLSSVWLTNKIAGGRNKSPEAR